MPTKETYIYEDGQARRAAPDGERPQLSKGAAAALEEVKKGSATKEQFLELFPEYAAYLN